MSLLGHPIACPIKQASARGRSRTCNHLGLNQVAPPMAYPSISIQNRNRFRIQKVVQVGFEPTIICL